MSGSTYNANANQITYADYCALGGAANPRLFSRPVYNGRAFIGHEYYLM